MGRSVNKVTLIGTLGRDPEVRYLPNGNAVANLSLATDESYNDKSTGQKVEQTEWHRITVYGRLAEIVQQYLKKGSRAYFEGKLRTREWEKDGVKRYTTEIICNDMMMLDSRSEGGMGSGAPMGGQQPSSPGQIANNMGMGYQQPPQQAPQNSGYQQAPQQRPPQGNPQSNPQNNQGGYSQPPQGNPGGGYQQAPQQPPQRQTPQPSNSFDDFDDDIPF